MLWIEGLLGVASHENPTLLSDTAALAAVALIGYLWGRRTRSTPAPGPDPALVRELAQASRIAEQLQRTTKLVRNELAAFRQSVGTFQRQLTRLNGSEAQETWNRLREEAGQLLGPTMKLGADLSAAYETLRRQTDQLASFVGARMDPTTGVHNRKALDEQLARYFAGDPKQDPHLAVGIFSLTPAGAHRELGENATEIVALAQLIDRCARTTDFVARYARDEFIILMPHASLRGAAALSARLIQEAHLQLGCPVWGGVVEALPHDVPQRLLARADAALYSARTQPQACLYQHDGTRIRRRLAPTPVAADDGVAAEAIAADQGSETPDFAAEDRALTQIGVLN